jgi:hypothetical protein
VFSILNFATPASSRTAIDQNLNDLFTAKPPQQRQQKQRRPSRRKEEREKVKNTEEIVIIP